MEGSEGSEGRRVKEGRKEGRKMKAKECKGRKEGSEGRKVKSRKEERKVKQGR